MASGIIIRNVKGIKLKNYVPPITCSRCGKPRDAGDFLVNEGDGDRRAFVQAPACHTCTKTKVDYVAGMFVRSIHGDDGRPVQWQQHKKDGGKIVPYGKRRDINEMGFRLMSSGIILPQSNLQSGLQYREGEHTPSLFEQSKKPRRRRAPAKTGRPMTQKTEVVSGSPQAVEIENAVAAMLKAIGEDGTRNGLQRTPHRVAKSMLHGLFAGYAQDPSEHITLFEPDGYDGIVLVEGIPMVSSCEHHMLPFVGVCDIAYIPGKKGVLGLSKFSRVLDVFARRLQVQERLTQQVSDFLQQALEPAALLVNIAAEHSCMTLRGVQRPGTLTKTSVLRGAFKDNPETRAEVFAMLAQQKG